MTDLRVVIFDVDGTLVDSQAHIVAASQSAFAAVGLPEPDRAEILGGVGLSLPLFMERLAGPDHADSLAEAYRTFSVKQRAEKAREGQLYPGTSDMLRRLNQDDHTLLAVATGKSMRGLDALIKAQDLNGLFVSLQTADTHPSKPHPSMIQTILTETGTEPGQAVMIGDTRFDMDMARAAGVASIGVPWGYHDAQTMGADQVIESWDELDAAIDRALGDDA